MTTQPRTNFNAALALATVRAAQPAETDPSLPACPTCHAPAIAGYLHRSWNDLAHDCNCVLECESAYLAGLRRIWQRLNAYPHYIATLPDRYRAYTLDSLTETPKNAAALRQIRSGLTGNLYLFGPAGCIAGETRLYNPITQEHTAIAELYEKGIAPVVQTSLGPIQAEMPFIKGVARLYRLRLASGRECVVTDDHLVFTPNGWTFVRELSAGVLLRVDSPCPPPSNSASDSSESSLSAENLKQIIQDCQDDCLPHRHLCGERLPSSSNDDQASAPLHSDALGCIHDDCNRDVQASEEGCTPPYLSSSHLSTMDYSSQSAEMARRESQIPECTPVLSDFSFQSGVQSPRENSPLPPSGEQVGHFESKHQPAVVAESLLPPEALDELARHLPVIPQQSRVLELSQRCAEESQPFVRRLGAEISAFASKKVYYTGLWDTLVSVTFERVDTYYDLHVPLAEHYLAEGIWHHNTGKTHLAVAAAAHLAGQGMTARFWGMAALFAALRDSYASGATRPELLHWDVLVLDDIDKLKPTPYVYETFYALVEDRWSRQKVTIFTAQLDADQAARVLTPEGNRLAADPLASRMASGIAERIDGEDKRFRADKAVGL